MSYLQFSRTVRDFERSGVHVPLPNRTLSLWGMNFGYNWPQFYSKDSFWLAQTIQHNPILLTLSQNKRHDLIWSNQNEALPELCSGKRKEKLSDSWVLSDGRSDRLIVLPSWGKPVGRQCLQQGWENLEKHNQSHDQTNPVDFYCMDNRLHGFSTLATKTLQQKQCQEWSTSRKVGVTKTRVRRFQTNLMALDDI